MSAEQFCFFKFSRPLLDRFGREFFRGVPQQPGVYLFTGDNGHALYVGHSKNLRLRLSYYKNAQPEREPRRIVRLVHQIRKIEMECCETVNSSQVRELALIRQLRPRFNVANTLSPTFSFFGLRREGSDWILRLTMTQARHENETIIGGFRNRGLCARAFCSLARIVVGLSLRVHSVYDFPAWLNSRSRAWRIGMEWEDSVRDLIAGGSDQFLQASAGLTERTHDPFLRQIFEMDMLTLGEFHQLARQMAELRRLRGETILSQEALQVSGRLHRLEEFAANEKHSPSCPVSLR